MTKTIKIARPKFPRSPNGAKGRVEHDARGNAVWTRSRADDGHAIPDTSELSMLDEPAERKKSLTKARR